MKRCPNCGTGHDDEDRFCAECGAHLETGLGGLDKEAEIPSDDETILTNRRVSERAKTVALSQQDIDATIRSQPVRPRLATTAAASTDHEVATKSVINHQLMIVVLVILGLGICLLVVALTGIVVMTYI